MSSGSYFDPLWVEKVTLPVKFVGGLWEFFYGGVVPVKEGALGELTISAGQLSEDKFRHRVTQELEVQILGEDTPLMVALSDRSNGGGRFDPWPEFGMGRAQVPPATTRFVEVRLGPKKELLDDPHRFDRELYRGGLWLRLKGLERSELFGSSVRLPKGFDPAFAYSLNHAYTRLSQKFETHRISNTGNVYSKVFYQDRDERWYPLDDLRIGVQARAERRLLHELWGEVERKLGWRPPAPPPDHKR
jgi:hypothetical protein